MEAQGIFGGTMPVLEKVLDLRTQKHNLIISNVANMDTPQYKTFDLIVEEEIKKTMENESTVAMAKTQPGHILPKREQSGNIKKMDADYSELSLRNDGNSVDIDKEMANLSENSLIYNATAQILAKKFKGLKNVIQGGRR